MCLHFAKARKRLLRRHKLIIEHYYAMSNIIEIDRLDHPGAEMFSKLTESQLRNRLEPQKGIFIAESPKVIQVALDAGYEPLALMTEHKHLDGQAKDIIDRCSDIPVYTGDDHLLESLTGYELTRGVLCAMRRPAPRSIESVCRDKHRIVVVDGVTNATNTGAIFRAAAALGMDAVLLTTTSCDPLNRRSVRVSMGTVFQIPWTTIADDLTRSYPARLHELGFKTAAMALLDNAVCINDPKLKSENNLAIILGNEGEGLAPQTIAQCDYVVRIPMQNKVDSLNVAAASAVAFWELQPKLRF